MRFLKSASCYLFKQVMAQLQIPQLLRIPKLLRLAKTLLIHQEEHHQLDGPDHQEGLNLQVAQVAREDLQVEVKLVITKVQLQPYPADLRNAQKATKDIVNAQIAVVSKHMFSNQMERLDASPSTDLSLIHI